MRTVSFVGALILGLLLLLGWSSYLFFILSWAGWGIWALLVVVGLCLSLCVLVLWSSEAALNDDRNLKYPELTNFRITMGGRGRAL